MQFLWLLNKQIKVLSHIKLNQKTTFLIGDAKKHPRKQIYGSNFILFYNWSSHINRKESGTTNGYMFFKSWGLWNFSMWNHKILDAGQPKIRKLSRNLFIPISLVFNAQYLQGGFWSRFSFMKILTVTWDIRSNHVEQLEDIQAMILTTLVTNFFEDRIVSNDLWPPRYANLSCPNFLCRTF